MSLLMQALRKAEEAKRNATKQELLNAEQQLTVDPDPVNGSHGAIEESVPLVPESVRTEVVAPIAAWKDNSIQLDLESMIEWEPDSPLELKPIAVRAEPEMTLSANEPLTTQVADLEITPVAKVSMQASPDENEIRPRPYAERDAAEESQRRASVRAAFNAKIEAPASRRRRMMGILLVLLLLPLCGGVYWLLGGGTSAVADFSTLNPPVEAVRSVDAQDVMAVEEVNETAEVDTEPDLGAANISALTEQNMDLPAEASAAVSDTDVAVSRGGVDANVDSQVALADALSEIQQALAAVEAAPAIQLARSAEAAENSEVTPGQGINVVRSVNTPRLDPVIVQAYSSFQAGDYVDAKALYQQALGNTPNSRDALLGLAAVAQQTGDFSEARAWYARLLEHDPRDALARAGLLGTMPNSNPVQLESELRGLFAAHPDIAPLPFALGNLYASQGRWSDAQQSYYDALLAAKAGASGPISPDYAFNLAISLEQLNQTGPAYNYYREALALAQQQTPSFDVGVLRQRLDTLERALP